jgi:hypothetical protein
MTQMRIILLPKMKMTNLTQMMMTQIHLPVMIVLITIHLDKQRPIKMGLLAILLTRMIQIRYQNIIMKMMMATALILTMTLKMMMILMKMMMIIMMMISIMTLTTMMMKKKIQIRGLTMKMMTMSIMMREIMIKWRNYSKSK